VTAKLREFVFRHLRRKTRLPIVVHVQRSGEILQVFGRCIDMSESGLLAAMEGELLDGEEVELDLHVTGAAQPMRVRASAHSRRTGQYAFQFQRSRNVPDAITTTRALSS